METLHAWSLFPKKHSKGSFSRVNVDATPRARHPGTSHQEHHDIVAFKRLNTIIRARSRRAELVIMNLPDIWDHVDPKEYWGEDCGC